MDPNGHIYRAPEDEIPAEDKARLEGYLRARAERDEVERIKQRLEELEAERSLPPPLGGQR